MVFPDAAQTLNFYYHTDEYWYVTGLSHYAPSSNGTDFENRRYGNIVLLK
jgi:hypothetical protein